MRILIAEDDLTSRKILEKILVSNGYEVTVTADGKAALDVLQGENPPKLVLLDWMMPELDGIEVCRRLRAEGRSLSLYLILLTARGNKEDIVSGLESGADDYIIKPFEKDELLARVQAGERILGLQSELNSKVDQLQEALAHVKSLQGIIPICAHCHKIRGDDESWEKMESYIESNSGAEFSHSICDECLEKLYPEDDEEKAETVEEPEKA
ncbi:MAG: response regulator transcription factor [Bacteroidales bacterium]|nr:response regulator transcription factor [Candidatus Latescibacterota bacterium]